MDRGVKIQRVRQDTIQSRAILLLRSRDCQMKGEYGTFTYFVNVKYNKVET